MRKKKATPSTPVQDKDFRTLATTSYRPAEIPSVPAARHTPKKRRSPWKKMIILIVLIVFGLFTTIVIWDMRNFSVASKKLFGTDNSWEVLRTTNLADTAGRTNILLVGYSVDDPGHAGAKLTDSIIIL